MIKDNTRIFVAGHNGLVGSAIIRYLMGVGFPSRNIITKASSELDLTDQLAVQAFFKAEKPEYVLLAAAKVGGIHANNMYPADFIYKNLMIQSNVIHQSFVCGVKRLLFLGSACIYPKYVAQPIAEKSLLTGALEPTNEPYAVAKIAGIKLCESYNRQYGTDFRSIMPTNLYGPNDNFSLEDSHVLPALLRKFHEAKKLGSAEVEVWGNGNVRREFLYVDDMAEACLHLLGIEKAKYNEHVEPMCGHVNIGTGEDISIKSLAELIKEVVGFEGRVEFNASMPEGTPQRLMDVARLVELGWCSKVGLKDGLIKTYQSFSQQYDAGRARLK